MPAETTSFYSNSSFESCLSSLDRNPTAGSTHEVVFENHVYGSHELLDCTTSTDQTSAVGMLQNTTYSPIDYLVKNIPKDDGSVKGLHYDYGQLFYNASSQQQQARSPWVTSSGIWDDCPPRPSDQPPGDKLHYLYDDENVAESRSLQVYQNKDPQPAGSMHHYVHEITPVSPTSFSTVTSDQSMIVRSTPPFSMPPSVLSTPQQLKPKYFVAHQPIPPEQRSSYSELTAHLEAMRRLEEEERNRTWERACLSTQQPPDANSKLNTGPSNQHSILPSNTDATKPSSEEPPGARVAPIRTKKRKPVGKASYPMPILSTSSLSEHQRSHSIYNSRATSVDTSSDASTPPSVPSSYYKEVKKPSQACHFCRERKISCGRPPQDAADQTCNQCCRRKFKCEYPKELERPSRRRHA